jgi:hypothetical protein
MCHAFIRELCRCRRGAGEAKALPALGDKFLVKGREFGLMFPRLIKKAASLAGSADTDALVDAQRDNRACGALRL